MDFPAVLRAPFGSAGWFPWRGLGFLLNIHVRSSVSISTHVSSFSFPVRAVGSYLGRSLSKKQQTSRWARRPLLDAQINYAACDALGLCAFLCAVLRGMCGLNYFVGADSKLLLFWRFLFVGFGAVWFGSMLNRSAITNCRVERIFCFLSLFGWVVAAVVARSPRRTRGAAYP